MSEQNYTVKEMVSELRRDVKAQSISLAELRLLQERTFEQATKTNGRLLNAEKNIEEHTKQINLWKAYITVIGTIVTLFGIPSIINLVKPFL